MKHEGQIVKKIIEEAGIPITILTKKIGKSRGWFYTVFNSPTVSIDTILKIGKAIHYDFSDEIKELKKYKAGTKVQVVKEPEPTLKSKQESPEYWKNKYLELLEKHNQVLLKLTQNSKSKSVKK